MNLTRWLSRSPAPAKLRVDGQTLNLAGGRNQWADAAKAIVTLNPRRVEALAGDGAILRVLDWQAKGALPDDDDEKKPLAVPEDRDVQLARILVEAGDKGAARVVDAFKGGFDTLTMIVTLMAKRQTALETAYHRQLMKPPQIVVEGAAASGEEGEDELDQMAKAMMMQMMVNQAGQKPPTPAAPAASGGKH